VELCIAHSVSQRCRIGRVEQYNSCSSAQRSAAQHGTVRYGTVKCSIVQYRTVLHSTVKSKLRRINCRVVYSTDQLKLHLGQNMVDIGHKSPRVPQGVLVVYPVRYKGSIVAVVCCGLQVTRCECVAGSPD
jgi:hypothetical protein